MSETITPHIQIVSRIHFLGRKLESNNDFTHGIDEFASDKVVGPGIVDAKILSVGIDLPGLIDPKVILIEPIQQTLNKYTIFDLKKEPNILASKPGEKSAMMRAIELVMENIFLEIKNSGISIS